MVVIGGGNAAVTAGMAAADRGSRVLILERAPQHMRGGNTRHTRNVRCAHGGNEFSVEPYGVDELWADLRGVGRGPSDESLAQLTVVASQTAPEWMQQHGARWQAPLNGTLQLARTNRFFLGGGKALLNSYYRHLSAFSNVTVVYNAAVTGLEFEKKTCMAAYVDLGHHQAKVRSRTFVCASGGYEANIEWLRQYWGDAVDNYKIRGTPYNDGSLLAQLYESGAASAGEDRGFHAVAVDARAPRFDGGIATRLDSIPFGIVINRDGERFYDEGEEIWPKRYAIWGRLIAEQPDQIAICIWDSKVADEFLPPMLEPESARSVGDLAVRLDLDPVILGKTIDTYNSAVVVGSFNPSQLDSCRTVGLSPEKSHWAQRIDTPPYFGIKMSPGITFTYRGVAIDRTARIRLADGGGFENIFAAGEIMSGNILSTGYLAGFGMTIGTVWGKQAGTEAARLANQLV